MENIKRKRFHKSDALVYTYNTVELPLNKNISLSLEFCLVHAAKDVKWKDITKEIHGLRETSQSPILGNSSPVLQTVMVDYPDFVVALTLDGAVKIIENQIEARRTPWIPHPYKYFSQVDDFAKEMVAQRDRYEWEQSILKNGIKSTPKVLSDFWPKD